MKPIEMTDEHRELVKLYLNRNIETELRYSAFHSTGKQDKQTEGYYKWLCLSAYTEIYDLNTKIDHLSADLNWLRKHPVPQGKWEHYKEYTNNRTFYITKCPFCKLRVQEETNFCPNCGADMRKGGAE